MKSATLENCLFGAAKLSKNDDISKYKYSGYVFWIRNFFTSKWSIGKNVIIFGAYMSSSARANNKTRSILVLVKDFIQGIDNTKIYPEKMHSTNFTVANKILFKLAL